MTKAEIFFEKIKDKKERDKFLKWIWELEFELLGLPIPTKVFFLNMPVKFSLELMKNRENKFTHENEKDIHENDIQYLTDAYNVACEVAKEYNWEEIKCVKDDKIRTIEDIHEEIYRWFQINNIEINKSELQAQTY